jgi:hypothetical protein
MRAIPREVDDALVRDAADAYAFGLWCADGYWWTSSIGISNVDPELVLRFADYLVGIMPPDRLRLRVYEVFGQPPDPRIIRLCRRISVRPAFKMKRTAYHLYVNSRPLVRSFFQGREHLESIPTEHLGSYFAGRFDGDGTFGDTPRIAYTTEVEARMDSLLLRRAGVERTSVLHYKKACEYCIYIQKASLGEFVRLIEPHSLKAERRFTL